MPGDAKFQTLVSDLANAAGSAEHQRALEKPLDAEGVAASKVVFEPTRMFLDSLGPALKRAGVANNLVSERYWAPANERKYFYANYRIMGHEINFFVDPIGRTVGFRAETYPANDEQAIEQAIQAWIIEELHT